MKYMKKWTTLFLVLLMTGLSLTACGKEEETSGLIDGQYEVSILLEGGSGKASIASPATLTIEDGVMTLPLVWSSKNYDYMIVDGVKYLNENEGGNSTFTITLPALEEAIEVIGDTTAMSTPHEITYMLTVTLGAEDGAQSSSASMGENSSDSKKKQNQTIAEGGIPFSELEKTGSEEILYATEFSVDYYGDYRLLTVKGDARYLLVPEGKELPSALPEDVTALQLPLKNTYLVSTSIYDLVREIGALDQVALIASRADEIHVEEVAQKVNANQIAFAGKYSAPDFELILSKNCDLAVENTMILHNPDVKEKLEELGIPVMVEHSSYESHPLGRLEWIKFYGALYGKEKEAEDFFNSQMEELSQILAESEKNTSEDRPVIAYFSVNTSGTVTVRKPADYIARMIQLAGGRYALDDLLSGEENALSTMNISFEDFYAAAKDADILIYNSAIEGEITSVADLKDKNPLFADFKAVKEGRVYCTAQNLFQESTGLGRFLEDLHQVCHDSKASDFAYLKRL